MRRKIIIAVVMACICVIAGCAHKPSAPAATPTSSPVVIVTAQPSPTAAAEKPLTSENKKTEIYIGNKNTKKFHKPSCYTLPAEKNCVSFDTRAQAIEKGYNPCGNCNPLRCEQQTQFLFLKSTVL